MKKILLLFLLTSPLLAHSQTAEITFHADTTLTAYLYREIDNCYNKVYPTDTIQLLPDHPIDCEVNVKDFSYTHIKLSNGVHFNTLLFPGDKITITYANKNIRFQGDNHQGLSYYCTHFTSGLIKYLEPMMIALDKYTNNVLDFNALKDAFQKDNILDKPLKDIEKLKQEKEISPTFADVLTENIVLFKKAYTIQGLRTLLLSSRYKEKALRDSVAIMNAVDSLLAMQPNDNPEFIARVAKQPLGDNYLIQYYYRHYSSGFAITDTIHFDNSEPFMHAPRSIQAGRFGTNILTGFEMGFPTAKIDCVRFLKHFPDSQYAKILRRYIDEDEKQAPAHSILQFDNISTLAEISRIEQIKGNYIFVDLWASWCLPCRKEFEFKEPLEALIHKFKNIHMVYISLDGGKNNPTWRKIVDKYGLNGIHIIANKSLEKEIREKIFNGTKGNIYLPTEFSIEDGKMEGNSITIPRYFLLDPQGKVLHYDLPRPSTMEQLNNTLENILNNKSHERIKE